MNKYYQSDSVVVIYDGYTYSKKEFKDVLEKAAGEFEKEYSHTPLWRLRSLTSLSLEWAIHNLCYNLNILRNHTKDVNLEAEQPWYLTIIYYITGAISWLFIK